MIAPYIHGEKEKKNVVIIGSVKEPRKNLVYSIFHIDCTHKVSGSYASSFSKIQAALLTLSLFFYTKGHDSGNN